VAWAQSFETWVACALSCGASMPASKPNKDKLAVRVLGMFFMIQFLFKRRIACRFAGIYLHQTSANRRNAVQFVPEDSRLALEAGCPVAARLKAG